MGVTAWNLPAALSTQLVSSVSRVLTVVSDRHSYIETCGTKGAVSRKIYYNHF